MATSKMPQVPVTLRKTLQVYTVSTELVIKYAECLSCCWLWCM